MKDYLLTLIAASLVAVLVGILSPDGERGGIAKHMKLLTSLFLVCVLISPLQSGIEGLQRLMRGELSLPELNGSEQEDYPDMMEGALNDASVNYFCDMLTVTIEKQFGIEAGEVRCLVAWEQEGETLTPTRVTVVLSGKAIWKDPHAIEEFVTELLGCDCATAIE